MDRKELFTIISLVLFAILISAFILSDENLSFEHFKGGLITVLISLRFFFMHALLAGIVLYSIIRLIKKRIFGYILPLVICLSHFAIVITIRVKKNIRESSPIVLKADSFDEIHGLTLYLRQNKTYKLSDYGFYGGTNHYGEYQISGDTILLSEKYPLGQNRDFISNKLMIQNGYILTKPHSKNNYSNTKLKVVERR